MTRVLVALVGVLVGLSVGALGCRAGAEQGPVPPTPINFPSSSPTDSPRLPAPLTIEWTGGIDGRHTAATVRADGSWTRTERRGDSASGHLDEGRLVEIARLATSDELRDEARRAASFRPSVQCADFVGVTLAMGDLVVDSPARFCGELELPTLSRIAGLVNDATN